MQQLRDLLERTAEQLKLLWSRVQDSPTYLDLKERYDSLPPKTQKVVTALGGGTLLLIVLALPLMSLLTSRSQMSRFEESRELTRELLSIERQIQSTSQLPSPPPISTVRSQVQAMLDRAQFTAEQILPMQEFSGVEPQNILPNNVEAQGLRVQLRKLNLRQITDLGSQLDSRLGPGVKLWSFSMKQNSEDPEYYDVDYSLVSFIIQSAPGGDS